MSSKSDSGFFSRLRSLVLALLALIYYFLARTLALHAANGLSSGAWFDLLDNAVLLFLLLLGYAAMGLVFQRQREPLKAMGLDLRPCARREFGIGAALGWGMMLACLLPIAVTGGLIVTFWTTSRQFGFFAINLLTLFIAALVQEVVFRGYFFQRLMQAFGSTLATGFLLLVVAALYVRDTDWTAISMLVALLSALLLTLAYLRTRALWLGWGFHFAWTATMAALFGLPVRGSSQFSSVVQSDARGPYALTGGGYGPEAGVLAVIALLGGIVVLIRVTREYAWQYAQPVIVAGGMPVDLDRAQQKQHESASVDPSATAKTALIQIAPVTSLSPVSFGSIGSIESSSLAATLPASSGPAAPAPDVSSPEVDGLS